MPGLGRLALVSEPSGPGVRVDSSLFTGFEVSPYYDSLLAKVIAWGRDRQQAIVRLRRALAEYQVLGVPTTIPFHRRLLDHPMFLAGEIETRFLERSFDPEAETETDSGAEVEALAAAALLSHARRGKGNAASAANGERTDRWRAAARHDGIERGGGGRWRSTS
jgi:acetyl/propionyl-CoA carboxylase alpha subunit